MRLLAFDLRLRALRIRRRKPNRLSRDTEELRNTDIAHCTLETRANPAHAQSGVRAFVGMIQPGLSEWKSTSPISAWNVGAGEGNRTLVFSLEVVKFGNLYRGNSDILQPSGRLKLLRNFSLSEWGQRRVAGFGVYSRFATNAYQVRFGFRSASQAPPKVRARSFRVSLTQTGGGPTGLDNDLPLRLSRRSQHDGQAIES
jgi:hypothetical protein